MQNLIIVIEEKKKPCWANSQIAVFQNSLAFRDELNKILHFPIGQVLSWLHRGKLKTQI